MVLRLVMVITGIYRVCSSGTTACGATAAANEHSNNAKDDSEDDTDDHTDDIGDIALSLSSTDLTDRAFIGARGNRDHGVGGSVHGESSVGDCSVGIVVVVISITIVIVITVAVRVAYA